MPSHGGILLQVPGAGHVGVRRRLSGVVLELAESATGMGAFFTGAWMGGGGCADVGNVLHRGDSYGADIRVRVVGRFPVDWESDG